MPLLWVNHACAGTGGTYLATAGAGGTYTATTTSCASSTYAYWTECTGGGGTMGYATACSNIDAQQQLINQMLAQQWGAAAATAAATRIYSARPAEPTAEEAALARVRLDRLHDEERVRQKKRADANARAKELLLSHLSPEQRGTFEKQGWFVVEGGRSKARYRIETNGVAGNVALLNGDKIVARFCGHCDAAIPYHDQHLAQKLMLEVAEDDYLKLANRRTA